jgi:hypothetical protein
MGNHSLTHSDRPKFATSYTQLTDRVAFTMPTAKDVSPAPKTKSEEMQAGWDAALEEFKHQALHLEVRGAARAAVTLYDAIRIAREGGLNCQEHQTG